MSERLVINEIYLSLQGESTFAGLPCVFVRLTACNLRCSYCDTAYAFAEGRPMQLSDVVAKIRELAEPFHQSRVCEASGMGLAPALKPSASHHLPLPLVELTGGEPLLQKGSLTLMRVLCDEGFTVLLETSGAHDISAVDPRVRRIMDLKCPSSGEDASNHWENLRHLRASDEIKFVLATVQDYEWMKQAITEHRLALVCPLLVSWVHPLLPAQREKSLKPVPAHHTQISRQELAERIIADALPVRFQVQLHKIIWPPDRKGV